MLYPIVKVTSPPGAELPLCDDDPLPELQPANNEAHIAIVSVVAINLFLIFFSSFLFCCAQWIVTSHIMTIPHILKLRGTFTA